MNLHLPDSEEASTSVPPTFTLALALLGWYLAKRDTQIGARSPLGTGLVPFTHRMGGAFVFFPPFLNVLGALLGLKKKKQKQDAVGVVCHLEMDTETVMGLGSSPARGYLGTWSTGQPWPCSLSGEGAWEEVCSSHSREDGRAFHEASWQEGWVER